jgi:hypothetical protein
MIFFAKRLKTAAGALTVGALLLLGGTSARAQRVYDPYYGDDHNHQQREKKAEKRHQKREKEELKRHQREEREIYGNDAELREHQREEREEVKAHQREEKEALKEHQRYERDDRYDDRYGDDPYGNRRDRDYGYGISQAAFDRGYQEGLRAGQDDRYNNRRYDYERHSAYRDADAGYSGRYGDRQTYRDSFREGYRRGYDEGYNRGGRYRRNGGWGSVLGDIFGRP